MAGRAEGLSRRSQAKAGASSKRGCDQRFFGVKTLPPSLKAKADKPGGSALGRSRRHAGTANGAANSRSTTPLEMA